MKRVYPEVEENEEDERLTEKEKKDKIIFQKDIMNQLVECHNCGKKAKPFPNFSGDAIIELSEDNNIHLTIFRSVLDSLLSININNFDDKEELEEYMREQMQGETIKFDSSTINLEKKVYKAHKIIIIE